MFYDILNIGDSMKQLKYGLLIVTLLFLLFLIGVYLSKKRMNNIENRIYKKMLISNLLVLITQIITETIFLLIDNEFILVLTCNISLSIEISWFIYFTHYIILISNEKNEKFITDYKEHEDYYVKRVNIILLIICFIQIILPSRVIVIQGEKAAIFGFGSIYTYIIMIGCMIIAGKAAYDNRKDLDKKKVLPFIFIVGFAVITLLMQFLTPGLIAYYIFFTLVTYLMYHTIENPDLRVIAELELARDQAEKSSRAKSDFLSSMSHEIKTPLNAIVGLSQTLKDENDVNVIHNELDDILIASQNLQNIVDSILDVNKLENHEIGFELVNYNPIEEFNNLLNLMKIRIGEKDIDIRNDYDEKIPEYLYGDKEKVIQILNNLLTNAIKYTEKGFVGLKVDCELNKDYCKLIISVKDSGRGLTDEQLKHLYTKFNRLDSDKDSDISGTGLGLAITKSLVELLNGKIEVESTEGMGSTFKVEINQKLKEE